MAVTYGAAQLLHANGFLAVFAAGYALRVLEMKAQPDREVSSLVLPVDEQRRDELATSAEQGAVYLTETVRVFNEHYERVAEFGLVIIFGALAVVSLWSLPVGAFIAVLFLMIRPAAVLPWLVGTSFDRRQRLLIGWFGLRGVGSLYYLTYALSHGLAGPDARLITAAVLCTGAASVFVHGISVQPLMKWCQRC
jgi:NhaP-type Na+/H+ or K+/H+ antiporter